MYQVNYKGLRRRESYDEVVSIIENDQAKIRYPNRVAVQILNSPYMMQLDTEALMDMQNQQDRMSKKQDEATSDAGAGESNRYAICADASPARSS